MVLLLFVLISAFFFYIKPMYDLKLEEKQDMRADLEDRLFKLLAEAKSINNKKNNIEQLKKDIAKDSTTFFSYSYIDKDYLRLINQFIRSGKLKMNSITFDHSTTNIESTLKQLEKQKQIKDKEVVKKEKIVDEDAKKEEKKEEETAPAKSVKKPAIKVTSAVVEIEGGYNGIKTFIDKVNKNKKSVVFSDIIIEANEEYYSKDPTDGSRPIKGKFTILFYSVDSVGKYYKKSEEMFKGKNSPYRVNSKSKDYNPFKPQE